MLEVRKWEKYLWYCRKNMILVILPAILAAILKIEICDRETTFHIRFKRFKKLFIVHTNFLNSYI